MNKNEQDLGAVARAIIDANLYMALGTADETGQPWVSPVYYAAAGYTEFYWVSSPEARHSRNLTARPDVGIVVFDSQAPIGTGQGVYMSAVAEELTGAELERGVDVFSARSQVHGARAWKPEDVRPPALYRLYRATASEHSVLDPAGRPDQRTPVTVRT
jgi:nitroimidazol reductase NimA-like FMN-containing flavoprotein (pyridoxamine 5'-phosphate oxidase superfamily)